MKIVKSRLQFHEVSVPIRGGYRVRFEHGKATVPDDLADILASRTFGGYYTVIEHDVLQLLQSGNRRVCVSRDMGLGDVLMATPLIRKLKRDYKAKIDFRVCKQYHSLFENNPNIDKLYDFNDASFDTSEHILIDLYKIVENMEAIGRHLHRADAFCAVADLQITPEERRPDYFMRATERAKAIKRIESLRVKRHGVVGYVVRSSTDNRNWDVAMHERVLAALTTNGYGVVLLDHEAQSLGVGNAGVLNLCGKLALREVAAVMAATDVIVTPDTGLFHMAAALDVPTVAYFGPMAIETRQAHTNLHMVEERRNCARWPCRSYSCLNREPGSRQPRCLSVQPWRVVAAVNEAAGRQASIRMAA
jgi:ADP-heptose:LPS heptosyltransferase